MSPAEYAMLTKVLVGAGILFVIAFIGNLLTFSNKFVNALVTAIVFGLVYGALVFTIDRAMLPPELQNVSQQQWLQMVGMSAIMVFVIDLIANMLSFSNRFVSALMTAVVFAIVAGIVFYTMGTIPEIPA